TRGTGADAAAEVTAVASLPHAEARCDASDAYWIDPGKKPTAAYAHLPLHRPRGTAGEGNRGGAVVLGAAVSLGRCVGREITANVARVKLDRVQAQVHVNPCRLNGGTCLVSIEGSVNATVTTS